jgi:hypothetical protein
MIDDAYFDESLPDRIDVIFDAVQHPPKISGVVRHPSVIVVDDLLILVISGWGCAHGSNTPSHRHHQRRDKRNEGDA